MWIECARTGIIFLWFFYFGKKYEPGKSLIHIAFNTIQQRIGCITVITGHRQDVLLVFTLSANEKWYHQILAVHSRFSNQIPYTGILAQTTVAYLERGCHKLALSC